MPKSFFYAHINIPLIETLSFIYMAYSGKFRPKRPKKNPPKKQKRKTQKYINEVVTYATNQAKWEAAEDYCADRGWEFKVLTEIDMGIKS